MVREPMSAGEAGSRVCPPMEPRKAKHTLSWPRGRGLGKAEGAQTPHSRPTGLQEVARRFRCRGCYSTVCDLPLDCPGEGRGLGGPGTRRTGAARAERGRGWPGAGLGW